MTVGNTINLVSAVFGALGALAVYKGSFAYEQVSFLDDANYSITKGITARNRQRQRQQRIGLLLIMFNFFMQGVARFFD